MMIYIDWRTNLAFILICCNQNAVCYICMAAITEIQNDKKDSDFQNDHIANHSFLGIIPNDVELI